MSELDARLTAALQADAPPERDPLFRVELLMRQERARFKRRVVLTIAVACVAAVLAALNVRAAEAWMAVDVSRVALVAIGATAVVFALPGVPIETLPGARTLASLLERWFQ